MKSRDCTSSSLAAARKLSRWKSPRSRRHPKASGCGQDRGRDRDREHFSPRGLGLDRGELGRRSSRILRPDRWAPQYIIRDRYAVYGDVFIRCLRAMIIRDRPTAPRSPWQNGYCERAIGSIRRECLASGICHLLRSYATYYNSARTHLSINKDAPSPRTVHAVGRIFPTPFLGGLHHLYVRV
jgi:hypothetical protein